MCQVDRERMLAAEAEEAQHGVFGIDTGEKTLLPAVDRFAEEGTDQKPAEAGEDREIVAPRKDASGAQTDRKEEINGDGEGCILRSGRRRECKHRSNHNNSQNNA